jgi:cell division protein FtsB
MEKRKIWSWFKNKYIISLAFFAVYILIFSQNNLIERMSYMRQLRHLEQQKEYYKQQIKENSEKLHQLKTNTGNLEKFAREEYLMKKSDEDVYVIVKEEE